MFHFFFQGLHAHIRNKHKFKLDCFECPKCDKYYTERNKLTAHMKYHSEKKLICDLCDKTFHERNKLRRHFIKHSGVKAWKCHLCVNEVQKFYYFRDHLKKHLKKFHDTQFVSLEQNYINNP